MSRSNLTDAISAIDRCSDDELRQIQALLSARLGERTSSVTRRSRGKEIDGGRKGSKTSKRSGSRRTLKKGNPQRKSQYATHPVYMEYKAAKKAVEDFSKREKISFKDVTGEARGKYDEALSNWLQTKSGFRASKTDHENSDSQSEEDQGVEAEAGRNSSSEEQTSSAQARTVQDRTKRRRTQSPHLSGKTGKYSNPPESWTPSEGETWNDLSRSERRRICKESDAQNDSYMQE